MSLRLELGPDDIAEPVQLATLVDSVSQALMPRYFPWLWGTDPIVWALTKVGSSPVNLQITLTRRWSHTVTGLIQGTYPDVRLNPPQSLPELPSAAQYYTQLSLTDSWDLPLRSQRDYTVHALEALVAAWDATPETDQLQWVLAPRPSLPIKKAVRMREQWALAAH